MASGNRTPSPAPQRPLVVGIGASAGGIDALQHFFAACPEDPGMAYVVVMHLAPDHKSELAAVLQPHTSLPTLQVNDDTEIEENHVYVAPPNRLLSVKGRTLQVTPFGASNGRRSPIDLFFRSLAEADVHAVGLILSGSGSDGAVGVRAIQEAGGLVAVQDPAEAAHASMPHSAIESSRVDVVLPVRELAKRLVDHRRALNGTPLIDDPEELEASDESVLRDIFAEVRKHTGHDFSGYKRSTVLRRLQRRLHVHGLSSIPAYHKYLKAHPPETRELQKDLLISVSSFFRDPEAFEALRDEVIPTIFSSRTEDQTIRVWVPGCATGEEAYSIAMVLLERAAIDKVRGERIQIFASDLDESALTMARKGRYPESALADIPERYHGRFVQRDAERIVVRQAVRDSIVFTTHNLLGDPPFSKLDLVSCRNVLIYLKRELQVSVLNLFSYALNENGYLFLGSSESTEGRPSDAFNVVAKQHRIYQRKAGIDAVPDLPTVPLAPMRRHSARSVQQRGDHSRILLSDEELHRRLLEKHGPPSAVVDETYAFLRLSPSAGRFLLYPAGVPNTNIVELVRPELRTKLRMALHSAFSDNRATFAVPIKVDLNGESVYVRLIVRPAGHTLPNNEERLALVMFIETSETLVRQVEPDGTDMATDDPEIDRLQKELRHVKGLLRTAIEDHESSKQEMRAANEELRSMNEEYKSTAEELETSKEELQSVNEELKTVNRELESKVEELRKANSDLKNLMEATAIGTLFLDKDLRIQRFTPPVQELFNIQPGDEGRPISNFTHHLEYDGLETGIHQVLETVTPLEDEVRTNDEHWYLIRIHPYLTLEKEVAGVVVTFVEITERKETELELRAANAHLKQRTKQVNALASMLSAAEKQERERLSLILHDDLQQLLFAASVNLKTAERQLTGEKGLSVLERACDNISRAIDTTRSLSSQLNPPVDGKSIHDLFNWLGILMDDLYGLSVTVDVDATDTVQEEDLQALLFRIVRELLFNVVKHAGVKEATLTIRETENGLMAIVADQGAGFDAAADLASSTNGTGLGLASIFKRIELIGGRFDVTSEPGEGTEVTVELPRTKNVRL
ncbi:MAG: PAS domain-containing protein [Bacteroidetes bacterium]|jgi:two-component system CheB/CheR fusion protein|nr:PAS domain-containing protein [Bacteroidota bacterium]